MHFLSDFQECPEGVVQEDCFKEIYAKFFPHGSEYMSNTHPHPLNIIDGCQLIQQLSKREEHSFGNGFTSTNQILLFADSSMYAHYVFKAFDVNCNGAISFRVRY